MNSSASSSLAAASPTAASASASASASAAAPSSTSEPQPLSERPYMVGVEATLKGLEARTKILNSLHVYRQKRRHVKGTLWSLVLGPVVDSSAENEEQIQMQNKKLLALFLWEKEEYQRHNMMEGNSLGLQIQAYPLLETFPQFSFWVQLFGGTGSRNVVTMLSSTTVQTQDQGEAEVTPIPRRISDSTATVVSRSTCTTCNPSNASSSNNSTCGEEVNDDDDNSTEAEEDDEDEVTDNCQSEEEPEPTTSNLKTKRSYPSSEKGAAASRTDEVLSSHVKEEEKTDREEEDSKRRKISNEVEKDTNVLPQLSQEPFNNWCAGDEVFIVTKWRSKNKQMLDYTFKQLKWISQVALKCCPDHCVYSDLYLTNNSDDPHVIMEFSVWKRSKFEQRRVGEEQEEVQQQQVVPPHSTTASSSLTSDVSSDDSRCAAHEWFISFLPVKQVYTRLQQILYTNESYNQQETTASQQQQSYRVTYWKQLFSSSCSKV